MPTTLAALLPDNEVERLQTLRQYDILHSLQEAVFNEFVELTARIFNLPISLIALVDGDEVEYKANEGLPGLRRQPRAEALCALAVREHKTIVLADIAAASGLMPEAALAAEAKSLRFYAGAPLAMSDHRSIGTLCVIDRRPRTFSPDEQRVLEHIAELVATTVAVRHYCRTGTGQGDRHWQLVQRHLTDEIRELVALVRYLSARFGTQVPVSGAVLEPVQRRLHDLGHLLHEYTTRD